MVDATHIGDSLKRTLKERGAQGTQGEFGIGLLSFWTVGESLTLSSSDLEGRTHQMVMKRNDPGYAIAARKALFSHKGTELLVHPLLPGLRQLSGEKIQSYLASELRDRIRKSGVRIRILDRSAKKELEVQPRQYAGRLLHEIGSIPSARGEIYLELYLNGQGPGNQVSLFRSGTRVVSSLTEIDALNEEPWNTGYLQGMIDAPFLQLTPGTRTGIIHDESFEAFRTALEAVRTPLQEIIAQEKSAAEEQTSRNILKSVQKAFKEAFLTLPPEDYQWFDLHTGRRNGGPARGAQGRPGADETSLPTAETGGQPAAEGSEPMSVPGDGSASGRPGPGRVGACKGVLQLPGTSFQRPHLPVSGGAGHALSGDG